jgi:ribosomal protein L32
MSEPPPPDECAHCGTSLRRHARACPECGADERTGWRESADTVYDGLDLPDSAYADDNASEQSRRPTLRAGIAWYWYVVAALLVASLVLGIVRFH